MEWLGSTIAAVINAGWKIYLAALIASVAFLFLPKSIIVQLGLDQLRQTYRTQAGAVLIISASLLLTNVISVAWNLALSPWYDWRFTRKIHKTLSELTFAEKVFLNPYIAGGHNTQYAEAHDGVAKGLEAKLILYRSSNISAAGGIFPYNMQPYARKILKAHPELLAP